MAVVSGRRSTSDDKQTSKSCQRGFVKRFLKSALGILAALGFIIGGWALIRPAETDRSSPDAAQLLRAEALRVGGPSFGAAWFKLGTNALPALCLALERDETAAGRFVRQRREWVARQIGWPGLRQPDPANLRATAARVIAQLGPQGAPTVSNLMSALGTESNGEARAAMIVALGRIGLAASNALPQLERLRHGDDEGQIQLAREAVESIEREVRKK